MPLTHPESHVVNGERFGADSLLVIPRDADFRIHDIATSMHTAPFGECGVANQHMRRFVGMTIGSVFGRIAGQEAASNARN